MKEKLCPFFRSKCKKEKCMFYDTLTVENKTTREVTVINDCNINLTKKLQHENAMLQNQTGAAIESFRNEMVASNEKFQEAIAAATEASYLEHKRGGR